MFNEISTDLIADWGQYCIILTLGLSFLMLLNCIIHESIIFSDWSVTKRIVSTQFLLMAGAVILLGLGFLLDDFSLYIVHKNSTQGSPWIYKLVSVWGNHEGSMLLWASIISFYGFVEVIASYNKDGKENQMVLFTQNCVLVLFCLYLLFVSNPFDRMVPSPMEGEGLNPLLRDKAMTFHPPLLYLGYVGLAMVFAYAVHALWRGQITPYWLSRIAFWNSLSFLFLLAGISGGAYWAYYELGWGGFWFWDPTENSGLMPLIISVAMMHFMILARKNLYHNLLIILAICAFSMTLLGTFLVRSGVLISIHSFASDPGRGYMLLLALVILSGAALSLFALRSNKLSKDVPGKFKLNMPITWVIIGSVSLIFMTFIILMGTLYPLILELLTGEKISVGAPYFNKVLTPFLLLTVAAMAIVGMKPFGKGRAFFFIAVLVSAILGLTLFYLNRNIIASFGISLGVLLIITSLLKNNSGELILRRIKSGMMWGHAGLGVMIIGISAQALELKRLKTMSIGDSIEISDGGFLGVSNLYFNGIKKGEKYDYRYIEGNFTWTNSYEIFGQEFNKTVKLSPQLRRYKPKYNIETAEVALDSNFIGDIYLVMKEIQDSDTIENSDVENRKGVYLIEIQEKPFTVWIWIGVLIMCVSGVIISRKYFIRSKDFSR